MRKFATVASSLAFALACRFAAAQDAAPTDELWRSCVESAPDANKVSVCQKLIDKPDLSADRRVIAHYHHAAGLLAIFEIADARADLERIKALDPASEYIARLEKEIDLAVIRALLQPCPPPRICR